MALTPQLGNDSTNVTIADPLENLPPLPTPDYATQNLERVRGTTLVLSLITIFVACTTALVQGQFLTEPVLCLHDLTHAFPLARFFLTVAALESWYTWLCCGLIWSEALLAFVCLCEVQLGDPGEIKRTKNTCLPVPEEIARVLRGEAPPLLGNLDGVDGRV